MSNTAVIVILNTAVFVCLIVIAGNIFTIFVFWKHRNKLKRTSLLLINLAVADLLVGLTELIAIGTYELPRQLDEHTSFNSTLFENITRRFAYIVFFRLSVFPCTHFSGMCICFDLATPPSSSKHQGLHLQCHLCVVGWNIYSYNVFS